MPKPTSSVAMLVISTGGSSERRDVGERLLGAALERDPDARGSTRPAAISPSVRGAPQPQSLAREIATSGSDEADAEHARRRARRPGRACGRATRGRRAGRRRRRATPIDRAEPEDPVVGGVVDQQAADDEARAAADAERRRDQADARADALARELVADDPEAQREDAAADALQHAAGDDDLERVAERRHDRAGARTASSEMTSIRRLPNMSPRRPKTGVETAAASR